MADLRRLAQRAVAKLYHDSFIHGRLGRLNSDGSYTIRVPDRPTYAYVQMAGEGGQTLAIARNPGTVPLRANLPVRMRSDNGDLVIEGVDFDRLAMVESVEPGGPPAHGIPVHHHRTGSGLEYEYDPKLFEAGRIRLETGFVIHINPFRYQKTDGTWDYWEGGTIDISSHQPATAGEHRWVLVGVDPTDNTATAAAGTAKADTSALTIAELDDIAFTGKIPCGAVRVREDDTDLSDLSKYVDAHGWFNIGSLQNVVEDTTPQLGGNLDAGSFAVQNVDHLKFDVLTAGNEPAYAEGNLYYSEEDKALTYHTDQSDVQVNIGQESVTRAKNDQGAAITNGQAVYVSGATGGVPDVKLARGDLIATARATIGLVTQASIADQAVGYMTTLGIVRGIDTSAFTVGDTLYLSPTTAGALTATQPSYPNFPLRIGVVTRSHASDGRIFVNPYMEREVYSQGSVLFADSIGRIAEDNTNFLWDNTNKHLSLPTIRALDVNGLRLADDAGNLGVFVADGGKVVVNGTVADASALLKLQVDADAAAKAIVKIGVDSGQAGTFLVRDRAGSTNYRNLELAGNDLAFFTADSNEDLSITERVRIKHTTGRIGIKQSDPLADLQVDGTVRLNVMAGFNTEGEIFIGRADDVTSSYNLIKSNVDSSAAGSYLTLAVHTGTVDTTIDALVLTGDGYAQPNALGEAWNAPTFNTGWGNVGAPYYNAGYRLFGDMVMLRGAVERSSGSLQTVFTLPTAYRPSSEVVVAGPVSDITIQTDGDVRVQSVISNGTDVFLDGIWFSI